MSSQTCRRIQHGGTATLVQSVPVDERHDGKLVWQGVVHVFDLVAHPKAMRAMRKKTRGAAG